VECPRCGSPVSWGTRQNSAASAPRQTHCARVTKPTSIYDTLVNRHQSICACFSCDCPSYTRNSYQQRTLFLFQGSISGLMIAGTLFDVPKRRPCQPWALNRGVTVVKAQASSRQQRATGTVPVRETPGFARRPARTPNYEINTTLTRHNSIDMDPIQAAIAAFESRELGEQTSYTKIAAKYNVDRSTLSRRHQGLQAPQQARTLQKLILNPQQELELVRYIKTLTERALPPTREMIRNFSSEVAHQQLSESWVTRFINRHEIHLISKWTTAMDRTRHLADSESKYRLYFELLHQKITQYHLEARDIYNIDEKGFLIGILGRSKRIFSRRMWEKKEVTASLQDGSREFLTLLACCCADGSSLPPGLIYAAASGAIRSAWVEAIKAGEHEVFVSSSPTGWSNNNVGLAWLEQVFDRYTKQRSGRWRLLILDGHGSHITMEFIDYCDRHRILLMILPPHSTHTLQPLDVVLFKPLS
jgi:hypothetical protein